jgi:hypothetical protein
MTTHAARFEREIAEERTALLANLAILEDRARAFTDWRRQVRQRPMTAVGVALAGGLLLAAVSKRRPRRGASIADDDDMHAPARSLPLLDRVVTALAVIAAERVMDVLGDMLPSRGDADADSESFDGVTTE